MRFKCMGGIFPSRRQRSRVASPGPKPLPLARPASIVTITGKSNTAIATSAAPPAPISLFALGSTPSKLSVARPTSDPNAAGPLPSTAATASVSTLPPPVTPSAIETLWQQAIAKIKREYPEGIDLQNKTELEALREFTQNVEEKKKEWEDDRWYYIRGGEKVFLRDHMDTVLTNLNRYASIGDIAIGSNPSIAGLAWSGFRFLLQVVSAGMDNMRTICESLDYLVRLLIRCSLYERLYIQGYPNLAALKLLSPSLLNLYVSALKYLCYAMRHLSHNTAVRAVVSIWSNLTDYLQNVKIAEMQVEQDASTAAKEVAETRGTRQDKGMEGLKNLLTEMQQPISHIESTVVDIFTYIQGGERHEVLEWLSKVGYIEDHLSINSLHHPETGKWLSRNEKFLRWQDPNGPSSLLWLHGRAGAGKSVLASQIIQGSKHEEKYALAYFYCNHQKSGQTNPEWWRDPGSVLRTLIKQLCLINPGGFPKPVLDVYRTRKEKADTSRLLNVEESKDLLRKLSAGFFQTTIVIDALDECDKNTRWKLFSTLQEVLREAVSSPNRIKILVTSRQDRDIMDVFNSFPSIDIRSELRGVASDISIYINSEIETFVQKGRCKGLLLNGKINEELRNHVVSTLDSKADGMFLWVRFQLLKISNQRLPDGVEEVLGKLPEDLAETYSEIWESIYTRSESEIDRKIVLNALTWLLYAESPLSNEGFIAAVSFNTVKGNLDISAVLDLCQNLIVYDEELQVLRFAHLSVREFLCLQGPLKPDEAHTRIATVCLNLITSHCYTVPIQDRQSLVGYCIIEWPAHVRQSGTGGHSLKDLWIKFLKSSPHYIAWLSEISKWNKRLGVVGSGVLSPLLVASFFRLWDIFNFFLHAGDSPKCYNGHGESPLHFAAQHGHVGAVGLLLEKEGVDVNCKSGNGLTPLSYAVRFGNEKVVQLLLEKEGVDVNCKDGERRTPLSYAAESGNEKVVQLLLEKEGVDVNCKDRGSYTPLLYAVVREKEKVVQLLLEKEGVDVNCKSSNGYMPLSCAARSGNEKVVQLLLEKEGVDVNCKDGESHTPLLYAARTGNEKVVQLLLEKEGVDVNCKDKMKFTPLSYAVALGKEKVVQLLLEKEGVDVNCKINGCITLLSFAATLGNEKVVQLLLEKEGVDVNCKDNDGNTPLSLAKESAGREGIV